MPLSRHPGPLPARHTLTSNSRLVHNKSRRVYVLSSSGSSCSGGSGSFIILCCLSELRAAGFTVITTLVFALFFAGLRRLVHSLSPCVYFTLCQQDIIQSRAIKYDWLPHGIKNPLVFIRCTSQPTHNHLSLKKGGNNKEKHDLPLAFCGTLRLKLAYRHLVVVRESVQNPGVFLCFTPAVLLQFHGFVSLQLYVTVTVRVLVQGCKAATFRHLLPLFGSSFSRLLSFLTKIPDQHLHVKNYCF